MGIEKQIAGYPTQLAPHLQLRRVLGEGGSSIVFEAFHTRLKVPVAVKLLSVRGALAQQARERLLREAELYALLDDPRIPRVYDVDELANGTPYVVMEFVPGGSLELLLSHGPLSPRRTVLIAKEVLTALVYVHARGVLHRDVKPANVILSESEGKSNVRLVDFGIAKVVYDSPTQGGPMTQQGTLVGTPHYMAPERLLGSEADEKADIYAVGVMLYEMLSGTVPFGGPTLGEVIAAVLRDIPTPISVLCPHVLPELADVVMRAMDRDPHLRFVSAEQMLDALSALESGLGGEVSSPRIVPASHAQSSRPPARPLSFPSLEVTGEDLYPTRKRGSSLGLPLLAIALAGAGAWLGWSEGGTSVLGYLRAQYQGQDGEVGSAAAQEPPPAPAEALTAAAPNAEPPEQSEGLFWDAPRRRVLEGQPRNLLLDVPGEHGDADLVEDGEPADSDELAAGEVAPAPLSPAAIVQNAERELRQNLRVRVSEDDEEDGRYYEPVRSVPLQPLLENIENMLRESAPPPEPAPLPRKVEEQLPDNPY